MSFTTKKILKTSLPLILGAVLVWYSLSKISIPVLLSYFQEANYLYIFFGLFFGFLSHLSRSYRWNFVLEPMGYRPKFLNNVMAVFIGYLVNYAVPRAGEVSRAGVMTTYEDIPFEKGFGTIVAERIADLVMMFLVIIIALFIEFDFIYNLVFKDLEPTKITIIIAVLAVGFVVLSKLVKKATSGFLLKIKNFFQGLIEGLTSIFRMKKKWAFFFHTIFIWVMYVLMFWATLPAIDGLNVPFGGILIGFIAGGLSIAATNGGIGLYPIAVASAFALFGVSEVPATAFGWIMWTTQTLMFIIFGALSFLFLPIYNQKRN